MKRQIQGSLYYLSTDIRYSLAIFWIILGSLLLLTVMADWIFGGEEVTFSFNLSFPIYIFAGIAGFLTVKGVFTYLIKMGVTRRSLFISTVVYFLGLSLLNAFIANLLEFITTFMVRSNVGNIFIITDGDIDYEMNHLADLLATNTWFTRIIIDTSISFFLLSAFLVLGLIFYRYGLIGGFSFVGLFIFTIIFGVTNGWLIDFFVHIFSDFSIVFFYQLMFVGLGVYLLSYLLLRRLTI